MLNSSLDQALDNLIEAAVRARRHEDQAQGVEAVNQQAVLAQVEAAGGRKLAQLVDTLIGRIMSDYAAAGLEVGYRVTRDPGLLLLERSE